MRKVIFYFLILLFSVWLGVVIHNNAGYVLIAYRDISIETSLWFAVMAVIVLFVLFYMLMRFGSGVSIIASSIRNWFSNRRKKRAHAQTTLALYDLIEGNWDKAEKKLLRSAKYSDMPLVNYLVSAFMAEKRHVFRRRDSYLRLVQKAVKERPLVLGIVQASLEMGDKQFAAAKTILENLHTANPKNIFVLQLLQQVYSELKDWHGLEKILPILRKRKGLAVAIINQLEVQVYAELLSAGIKNNLVDKAWENVPRYLQKNSSLVAIYSKYLLSKNRMDEVEMLLKIALHKVLDESLLELYSEIASPNPIKLLARAEGWLQENQENPDLLLCLGRICHTQKLWGKACHYLEKCVRITPNPAAYAELGKIMEEQGDLRSALEFYNKGLGLYIK